MQSYAVVILMVEDEALLRFHISDVIREAGFEVIEAANADAALQVLSARDDIRVLVTDVNMPGEMDGIQLAGVSRERVPPIELIIMSGMVRPTADELPARAVFIPKPVDEQRLVKALHSFLPREGTSHRP